MELGTILRTAGSTFVGDRVAVRGFVYKDPDLRGGEFRLTRYMVVCCIVHAVPVSIVVHGSAEEFADGQWVAVYGVIRTWEAAGKDEIPFLVDAERVEPVEQPSDPYINKWFLRKPFRY